jgi:thiamine pyrophosphate-dependent acetolactate synthase large subunit-like protein
VKLAEAFGVRGVKVQDLDDLGDAIRAGFVADGPMLVDLDVVIDPPWEGVAPLAAHDAGTL